MAKFYYTEKQFNELCKDIVILHDTREQENGHILAWFDKHKIKHKERALKYGDYSFMISVDSADRYAGLWFTDEVFIERKNSLDELAGSVKEQRFYRELREAVKIPHKYLLVERTDNIWQGILAHKYRSAYDHKAYYNTLRALQFRYGIHIECISEQDNGSMVGQVIYSICKTALKSTILTN